MVTIVNLFCSWCSSLWFLVLCWGTRFKADQLCTCFSVYQSSLHNVGIKYLLKQKQNPSNSPLHVLWVGNVLKGIINFLQRSFCLWNAECISVHIRFCQPPCWLQDAKSESSLNGLCFSLNNLIFTKFTYFSNQQFIDRQTHDNQ